MLAVRRTLVSAILLFLVSTGVGMDLAVAQPAQAGEFFIISSVDPVKEQLLVKRPTEVTQVMRVDAQTKYVDRDQKPIKLMDVHAGDTVYITSSAASGVALEVRKGPMTVAELHRRYLLKSKH
jgi:hypothetical protein